MSLADRLINKLDPLLKKYNVTERVVYKREYTVVGGDELIGRGGTRTYEDTALDPQPMVVPLSINFGNKARNNVFVVNGEMAVVGDLIVYLSSTSITRDELLNTNLTIVFKLDTSEEEYHIVTYEPAVVIGKAVYYKSLLRSKGR